MNFLKKHFFSFLSAIIILIGLSVNVEAADYVYLEPGSNYSDTLTSSKDVHWYTFNTTEDNSDIRVYLSNTTAPMYFEIYNSDMKRIDYSLTSYLSSLKADTYYIKVYPSGWGNSYSKGTYEIVTTYWNGQVNHDTTTHEPNDTREMAFNLTSGKKESSLISNALDYDFYKFTTNIDNGDVYVYLSNTTAPAYFSIYDSNKQRLDYSLTSYFAKLKAGTYYIQVHSTSWSNVYTLGTYDIKATYSTPTVKQDTTTFEPNDTRENAFPLKSGVSLASTLENKSDYDYYEINLTKAGNINVGLTNTTAPTYFAIYDSNKSRLDYSLTSFSRQLAAGKYYILVHSNNWANQYSKGNYTLTASYPNVDKKIEPITLYLNSKKALINGKSKTLAVAPFTKQETTLVPLRFVSEELGAKVQWDSQNGRITVLLDGTKIVLTTTSHYVEVNGYSKRLQVKPEIINGTTFVPLRFVSEELGKSVQWNAKNGSITIK